MRENRTPIGLRYFPPARALRDVVSSYYLFHADLGSFADMMRADLPQVRFMLSGTARYFFQEGGAVEAPKVTIMGPTFGAYKFEIEGPALVFGVGLLPSGWAALTRENAGEFADCVADAEALFGPLVREAHEQMLGLEKINDMAAVVNRLIGTLLCLSDPPLWFTRVTEDWLMSSPSPEVDSLIAAVGMSSRQVERLTKRIYGAPPKLLARKYRALKAASELARGQTGWADVVGDSFSDQSHFIREFRQFIGLTPKQLIVNPPPVMRLTLGRRDLSDLFPELTKIT